MRVYNECYEAEMNYEEYVTFLKDLYGRGHQGPARHSIKKCRH